MNPCSVDPCRGYPCRWYNGVDCDMRETYAIDVFALSQNYRMNWKSMMSAPLRKEKMDLRKATVQENLSRRK